MLSMIDLVLHFPEYIIRGCAGPGVVQGWVRWVMVVRYGRIVLVYSVGSHSAGGPDAGGISRALLEKVGDSPTQPALVAKEPI